MEPVELTTYTLHMLFAGLWTGSVLFVTYAILPVARDGDFDAGPLHAVGSKLTTVSRVSALVLLLTGSHMAAARYTRESLTGTDGGNLVLAMVALWFVLAATVEIATGRLTGGTGKDKVREPARESWRLFQLASLFAILLLVNAGLLSANNVGFL